MGVYKDMAHDAGYRGEEAEQMAQAIEQDHMRQCMEHQEQEPDQIDMMDDAEVRSELRSTLVALGLAQKRGDGHAETLRGIASMNPQTEGDRMRQWARDGLSGYVETTESTVKIQQDRIEQLEAGIRQIQNSYSKRGLIKRLCSQLLAGESNP